MEKAIKCNNCGWIGLESQLNGDEENELCPNCKSEGKLMDLAVEDLVAIIKSLKSWNK